MCKFPNGIPCSITGKVYSLLTLKNEAWLITPFYEGNEWNWTPQILLILLFSRKLKKKKKKQLKIFTSSVDRPLENQRIIKYSDAIKDRLVPTPGYMDSPSSLEAVITHKREGIANSLQVKNLDCITLGPAEHFPNFFQREDWILPTTRGAKRTIELLTPIMHLCLFQP